MKTAIKTEAVMSGQLGSIISEERFQPLHPRHPLVAPTSWVAEPESCFVCESDTSVGTPLFYERSRVTRSDGTRTFICATCVARMCSEGHRRDLASENLIEAVVAGIPNVIL